MNTKTLGHSFGVAITFFLLSNSSLKAEVPRDPAEQLFEAFSASCESQGSFAARALGQTRQLEGVMTEMLNECPGLSPLLKQVRALEFQLERLENGWSGEGRGDLENLVQKLNLMLVATSSPDQQAQLSSEIVAVRIALLGFDIEIENANRRARAEALRDIDSYIALASQAYATQSLCFERNQFMPIHFAAHLVSLSGGFF